MCKIINSNNNLFDKLKDKKSPDKKNKEEKNEDALQELKKEGEKTVEDDDEPIFKIKIFTQGTVLTNKDDLETIQNLIKHENEANTLTFTKTTQRDTLISAIDKSNLTPDQKAIAKKLLGDISNEQLDDFENLLKDGTLTKKDSEGVTILERMDKMVSTPRHDKLEKNGVTAKEILNQTIRTLADPDTIGQGANKGTCGAATMEFILMQQDPAEAVKMIEGLTSKSGSVTLRDGKKLTLPENSIPGDKSGRKDIDRLLQSSIMNEANLMGLDYDNPSDDGGFIASMGGNSAIPLGKFKDLYSSVTGRPMTDPSSYLWGEEDVSARLQSAVAKGEKVPVMMSFEGAFKYHWLTVEKVEYGADGKPESVILRNPWGGDIEKGKGDPPRQDLGGGHIRMKWNDFVKRVDGAILPEDLANKPIDGKKMPVQARVDAIKTLMDGYTNGKEEAAIKELLLSSSPEDLSAILDKINLDDLVSELDDKDLGSVMSRLGQNPTAGNNAKHLHRLMQKSDDDVTRVFMSGMSDDHLKELAKTPEGRAALQQARKNMDEGWTTDNEYKQMGRIDNALNATMNTDDKAKQVKTLMSGYTNSNDEQAIKKILLNASPQELSDILNRLNPGDLASELDDKDLAEIMKKLAQNPGVGNNAKHLESLMKKADDDTAMAFLKGLSEDQLKALAATPGGKAVLDQAWRNLDSGWTNSSEEAQMKRIRNITGK